MTAEQVQLALSGSFSSVSQPFRPHLNGCPLVIELILSLNGLVIACHLPPDDSAQTFHLGVSSDVEEVFLLWQPVCRAHPQKDPACSGFLVIPLPERKHLL